MNVVSVLGHRITQEENFLFSVNHWRKGIPGAWGLDLPFSVLPFLVLGGKASWGRVPPTAEAPCPLPL